MLHILAFNSGVSCYSFCSIFFVLFHLEFFQFLLLFSLPSFFTWTRFVRSFNLCSFFSHYFILVYLKFFHFFRLLSHNYFLQTFFFFLVSSLWFVSVLHTSVSFCWCGLLLFKPIHYVLNFLYILWSRNLYFSSCNFLHLKASPRLLVSFGASFRCFVLSHILINSSNVLYYLRILSSFPSFFYIFPSFFTLICFVRRFIPVLRFAASLSASPRWVCSVGLKIDDENMNTNGGLFLFSSFQSRFT